MTFFVICLIRHLLLFDNALLIRKHYILFVQFIKSIILIFRQIIVCIVCVINYKLQNKG